MMQLFYNLKYIYLYKIELEVKQLKKYTYFILQIGKLIADW